MKKLIIILFSLLLFIPFMVFAEEKSYEYFNFVFDRVDGEKINETEVKIFASVTKDESNLTDRTSEFNVIETMWSVCVDEACATNEQVAEDAVFEVDKTYVFMIRVSAKNGASINVWGTDRAMLNGTSIEELDGEFGNTGNELMIKSKSIPNIVPIKEESKDKEDISEIPVEEITTIGAQKSCVFGLSLCCSTFLGLSLCVWILIFILIVILILLFIAIKNGKSNPEQPIK